MNLKFVKIMTLLAVIASTGVAGKLFHEHRSFREPVVAGEGLSSVKKLGDYSKSVAGTINDANVYIFDSGVPGGAILIIGTALPDIWRNRHDTHPPEILVRS